MQFYSSDFVIRGDLYEEAVLCTENASYAMRVADTSNALLLLPSLKTPKCTGIVISYYYYLTFGILEM